jgi:hypothetical protein
VFGRKLKLFNATIQLNSEPNGLDTGGKKKMTPSSPLQAANITLSLLIFHFFIILKSKPQ